MSLVLQGAMVELWAAFEDFEIVEPFANEDTQGELEIEKICTLDLPNITVDDLLEHSILAEFIRPTAYCSLLPAMLTLILRYGEKARAAMFVENFWNVPRQSRVNKRMGGLSLQPLNKRQVDAIKNAIQYIWKHNPDRKLYGNPFETEIAGSNGFLVELDHHTGPFA